MADMPDMKVYLRAARRLGWGSDHLVIATSFHDRLLGMTIRQGRTGRIRSPFCAIHRLGRGLRALVGCDGSLPRATVSQARRSVGADTVTGIARSCPGAACSLSGARAVPDPHLVMAFPACASVHTFGMRLPLDIAFIDSTGAILALYKGVPPGRIRSCPGAAAVLERFSVLADSPRVLATALSTA